MAEATAAAKSAKEAVGAANSAVKAAKSARRPGASVYERVLLIGGGIAIGYGGPKAVAYLRERFFKKKDQGGEPIRMTLKKRKIGGEKFDPSAGVEDVVVDKNDSDI